METKEIKIEAPEGYEIDVNNSSLDRIVFKKKKKKLTYEDICDKLFDNDFAWVIETGGEIIETLAGKSRHQDSNNLTSKKQAEKILALIKLMNVATYLNDGWKPDWNNDDDKKYYIWVDSHTNIINISWTRNMQLQAVYFKSESLAQQAIKILGIDVIRLALSTDY